MKVFVTGATGFIGSAIVAELQQAGHDVAGLARSDASVAALAATGAEVVRGGLEDLEVLRDAAAGADGVIHTAYNHDFSDIPAAARLDFAAVEALTQALEGTNRPLVIPAGTAGVAPGRLATERDMPDPNSPARHPRIDAVELALSFVDRGVRTSVVRLAPTVHGEGDHGFIPIVIDAARRSGVSVYVGDGRNRWPAVHRLDAAHLFCLALDKAGAGAVLHGVADEGVPISSVAEVIGRRLDLPVRSISLDEARAHLGFLAGLWSADIPASSALTRASLGWVPVQEGLIADLEQGHYFAQLQMA